MNKNLGNIDELFQTKLNGLSDDDLTINDALIWNKIENKLDKKPRLVVLWWQYGVAACLMIALFFGWRFGNQTEKTIVKTAIKPTTKQKVAPINNVTTVVIEKKVETKPKRIQQKKSLQINLELIENEKSIALKMPQLYFKDIKFKIQVDSGKLLARNKKLRVIHLDDINKKPIEILKENKSIYVQFNPKGAYYQDAPPNKEIIIPFKSSKN
ncbi:MAG: hypothetical protein MUF45_02365 [Spirosomaceae bacterium]|jgi:hypothetical protein|nr:hypothetical protein [Spirosomataceae bacterium]